MADIFSLSNESRSTPRWTAVVWYHTEQGLLSVVHDFMELEDLQNLMERGPDWHSLKKIEITHNAEGRAILTVENTQ